MPRQRKKIIDVTSAIVLLVLATLDVALWNSMRASMTGASGTPTIYFLPVTQGESALLALPNGVSVLIDAGSDAGIVDDLQKTLPANAPSYIDLAFISDPQPADYEGYHYLLAHYQVGAFIYNGRADSANSTQWTQLLNAIASKHIPLITLGAGDMIRYAAGPSGVVAEIDILSPDVTFAHSPDPADTGLVERIITTKFSALLAADIGTNVEGALLALSDGAADAPYSLHVDLRADILKAPFPGLGTPGGDAFLHAVAPRVLVLMPGVKNTASAPTKAMLAHLASSTNAAIVSPKPGSFLLYNK